MRNRRIHPSPCTWEGLLESFRAHGPCSSHVFQPSWTRKDASLSAMLGSIKPRLRTAKTDDQLGAVLGGCLQGCPVFPSSPLSEVATE